MSIQKHFLAGNGHCKVVFTVPESIVDNAKKVALLGDFNDWNPNKNVMKKTKGGRFETTVKLETGKEYQYRYLLDDENWETDWNADELKESNYGTFNSIVKL
jgi:1,4-alpha-glucan branching enzyme